MDYTELKQDQQLNILRGRMAMLEEHHYKVMLDIEDAESVGDEATREAGEARRSILETQMENTRNHMSEVGPKRRKKNA